VAVAHSHPTSAYLAGEFLDPSGARRRLVAFGHRNRGLTIAERRIPMSTNIPALQIDSLKSQTAPSAVKWIVVLCMIGVVAGLVLLSSLTGAPDVSNISQLVGP
jgi:hypothetical protein